MMHIFTGKQFGVTDHSHFVLIESWTDEDRIDNRIYLTKRLQITATSFY